MKLLILALLCLAGSAFAQERSASGALDTELTWSALSSQLSTAKGQLAGANVRIDQVIVCGKKSMLYAPGAGADSQGCVAGNGSLPPSVLATLNTNTTNIQLATANVTVIAACSQSGGTLALSGSSLVCNPAVNPIEPSFKAETASFTEAANGGTPYCINKGYDAMLDATALTDTHHCGGSTGGDCTYVTGYSMKCIRAVRR